MHTQTQPKFIVSNSQKQYYNSDPNTFCILEHLTEERLHRLSTLYLQAALTHLIQSNPQSSSIPLFSSHLSNGVERFKFIKGAELHRALGQKSCASLTPETFSRLSLNQKRELDQSARDLVHSALAEYDVRTLRGVLRKPFLNKLLGFDPIAEWNKAQSNGIQTPSQFLDLLCDITGDRPHTLRTRQKFNFFQVLHSQNVLLFPIAFVRNCRVPRFAGSRGRDPQKYLNDLGDPRFANHMTTRSIAKLEGAGVSGGSGVTYASQLRCSKLFLFCISPTTLGNLPAEALRQLRLQFESSQGFLAKKPESRMEDARVLKSAFSLFSTQIGRTRTASSYLPEKDPYSLSQLDETHFLCESEAPLTSKGSGSFMWVSQQCATNAHWAHLAHEYVSNVQLRNKDSLVGLLSPFFDWLVKHRTHWRLPLSNLTHDDLASSTSNEPSFFEYLQDRFKDVASSRAKVLYRVRHFFDWLITNDHMRLANPIRDVDIPTVRSTHGKTRKITLPPRITELMIEIITNDNFAWPKAFREDYVTVWDPDVKSFRTEWCPVRAIAFLILLTLPLRSKQLRMLDSGEFDELVYCTDEDDFVENPRGVENRRLGVLRKVEDELTSRSFIGFYIPSNKWGTDTDTLGGYTIPWDHPNLRTWVAQLITWQFKYNPVKQLLALNSLSDRTWHVTDALEDSIPSFCFLLRDPCTKREDEPVSRPRLERFLLFLLAEVEARFKMSGEELNLITQWAKRQHGLVPDKSQITLHSLRASGITTLAEAGVPIHILSEFVAGHSTLIMNLYYQKSSKLTISELITKALTSSKSNDDYFYDIDALRKQLEDAAPTPDDLSRIGFLTNGETASAVSEIPSSIWSISIDGICPNGRTLCHNGGPPNRNGSNVVYDPVPGGPGNCSECRHWVTGPRFLHGLMVVANTQIYRARELGDELEAIQERIDESQNHASKRELSRLRAEYDRVHQELMSVLSSWVARSRAIQDSLKRLQDEEDCESSHSLVSSDSNSQLVLEECQPHMLRYFVSKSAEIIPGRPLLGADREQSIAIDNMLSSNGISPFLYRLRRDDALRLSNAIIELLQDNMEEGQREQVLTCQTSLPESDIRDSLLELLEHSSMNPRLAE